MDISRFPSEILSVILTYLNTPELPWPNDVKQVANARLVCRQWNDLATPHLFHSLHIGHHGSSLRPWDALLDVPHVRNAVQRVTVLAAPVATMQEWNGRWSEGAQKATYHALMECVARIAELPNLRELDVRFHQWCAGPQRLRGMGVDWRSDFELPLANDDVFRTVFVALRNRVANMLPATPVRSLTLTNPQNMPIPELVASNLFTDVVMHVDSLHLLLTEESIGVITFAFHRFRGRQELELHIQHNLLPPLSSQLTVLTLAFYERWGLLPAYFNPRHLVFPRLKKLTLAEFVIGHHDHLDWILEQTSLTSLCLDRCYIVSHLRIPLHDMQSWCVQTNDWEQGALGSYGFTGENREVYTFPGTWASLIHQINTRLLNLMEFRLENEKPRFWFRVHGMRGARLSNRRYIACDTKHFPSPWLEADQDGELEFGNNDPEAVILDCGGRPWDVKMSLNRAAETEQADGEALEALLRAIRGRWRTT